MPLVPDLNIPKRDFGKWTPDKVEQHNLRYWKAKKAKVKPIKSPKYSKKKKKVKMIDNTLISEQITNINHIKSILHEE